jgi:hypothetical protein
MAGMETCTTPREASARSEGPARRARSRRLVDFADPAVWAWIVVVAMLALPAAATLA